MNEFLRELADLLDKYGIELIATDGGKVAVETTVSSKTCYSLCFNGYVTAEKLRAIADMMFANARAD